jgi:hypothetical protein
MQYPRDTVRGTQRDSMYAEILGVSSEMEVSHGPTAAAACTE